jgi:bacillithiol biosynthesis cysteine-adding enzyme BshC
MRTLRLRASQLPHASKLLADYLAESPRARAFFAHPPSLDGAQAVAGIRRRNPPRNHDRLLAAIREQNRAFGSDAAVFAALDRLAKGAVAVVSGQQVGLLGGPAYSVYKALAASRAAGELGKRGVDAVAVFWLATQDHDLAEVNHVWWPGRAGALEKLEIPADQAQQGRPVGQIPLGPQIEPVVARAREVLSGPGCGEMASAISSSYRPQETLGSAFGKLMARVLAGRGIILMDPLDERIHSLASPLLRQVIGGGESLTAALMARSKALEKAGYHAQVRVTERSFPLFLLEGGRRIALRLRNGDFVAGDQSFAGGQLAALASDNPELLSPNALLRPVMQDALLPTAAYIAGPAETAYFAQASVLYERLGVLMPAILPRAGFTLIEPELGRLLKKYHLEFEVFLAGRQALRKRMELEFLSASLDRSFAAAEKQLRANLKKLHAPLGRLDRTLLGARDTAERKMMYQLEKLRGKAARAHDVRTGILSRHENTLRNALWPHHGLQERAASLLPLLARQGGELLDKLQAEAWPDGSHYVMYL